MGELIPCNFADCKLIRRDLRARIQTLERRIERAAAHIPGLCPLCEEALIQVRDALAGEVVGG